MLRWWKSGCLAFAGCLAGCTTTVNLYSVEGPMAAIKPLPVMVATVDGITGNTGNISLPMPSGELHRQ